MDEDGNLGGWHEPRRSLDVQLVAALDDVLPRLTRAIRLALNQAEGDSRLLMPQVHCLRLIAQARGPVKPSVLARELQVTPPTMTRTVDTMVERGLIERVADPIDRRAIGLRPTDQGREVLERYQAEIDERLYEMIWHLSHEQRQRVLVALEDLAAMLDADELAERAAD